SVATFDAGLPRRLPQPFERGGSWSSARSLCKRREDSVFATREFPDAATGAPRFVTETGERLGSLNGPGATAGRGPERKGIGPLPESALGVRGARGHLACENGARRRGSGVFRFAADFAPGFAPGVAGGFAAPSWCPGQPGIASMLWPGVRSKPSPR